MTKWNYILLTINLTGLVSCFIPKKSIETTVDIETKVKTETIYLTSGGGAGYMGDQPSRTVTIINSFDSLDKQLTYKKTVRKMSGCFGTDKKKIEISYWDNGKIKEKETWTDKGWGKKIRTQMFDREGNLTADRYIENGEEIIKK